MPVHRINLKGPWNYEWIDGFPEVPVDVEFAASGRVKMPVDWLTIFGPCAGRVRFRRRFHQPTNLDPDERVWIAFHGTGGTGTVAVNGTELGKLVTSADAQRFDATQVLAPNCELVVELSYDPGDAAAHPGGLYAPVAIEIESTA